MAEVTLELIGEQLTRMFEEMRALKAEVTDLKDKVATKEQLGLVWRSLELKIELGLDQQHDAMAELKRSVAEPGSRRSRSARIDRGVGGAWLIGASRRCRS